jgi:hypothetical protein
VFSITFGSQVICQYKMDLFPVSVRGSRNYFVCQNCGGVRVQVLEFLQHSVCTCMMIILLLFLQKQNLAFAVYLFGLVLSTHTHTPFAVYLLHELKTPIRSELDNTVDLLLRSWGHKSAKTAAGALWQPGGRAGPGTLVGRPAPHARWSHHVMH